MYEDEEYGFCPECGALMKNGVCISCGYDRNKKQPIRRILRQTRIKRAMAFFREKHRTQGQKQRIHRICLHGKGRIHRMSSPPRMLRIPLMPCRIPLTGRRIQLPAHRALMVRRMPPMVLRMLLTAGRMPLMVPQTLHTERRIRPAAHRARLMGHRIPHMERRTLPMDRICLMVPRTLTEARIPLMEHRELPAARRMLHTVRTYLPMGRRTMPAACREALRTELMAVSTARATDRGRADIRGRFLPEAYLPMAVLTALIPTGPKRGITEEPLRPSLLPPLRFFSVLCLCSCM